jgi:hypothetical protein
MKKIKIKNKKMLIIGAGIAAVCLALIVAGIWYFKNSKGIKTAEESDTLTEIVENNEEEITPEPGDSTTDGGETTTEPTNTEPVIQISEPKEGAYISVSRKITGTVSNYSGSIYYQIVGDVTGTLVSGQIKVSSAAAEQSFSDTFGLDRKPTTTDEEGYLIVSILKANKMTEIIRTRIKI